MANKSAAKVHIETYDEILGGAISGKGGALEIDLSKLHEFKGHPFHVVDDEKMKKKNRKNKISHDEPMGHLSEIVSGRCPTFFIFMNL